MAAVAEKLDFSVLWQSERWSDFKLVIKPREPPPEVASTSAPAGVERRTTRSTTRGPQGQGPAPAAAGAAPAGSAATGRRTRQTARRSPEPCGAGPSTSRAAAGLSSRHGGARGVNGQQAATAQQVTPDAAPQAALTHEPDVVVYPVHAPVLISTSEYFRTLITSWSCASNTITLEVEADEVEAAKLMLEYMYKGTLPESPRPQDLLRMIKLADQYGVNRFLTACNSKLEKIPIEQLSLEDSINILSLPTFLLDSPSMATARRRAEDKLHEMFGDLEAAWFDTKMRSAFLRLPFCAVKYLLARTETAVHSENTIVVVASDWLHQRQREARDARGEQREPQPQTSQEQPAAAGPGTGAAAAAAGAGAAAGAAAAAAAAGLPMSLISAAVAGGGSLGLSVEQQMDELFELIRVPFLSPAFLDMLPQIGWLKERLEPKALVKALQLVKSEGRVHDLLVSALGQGGVPRAMPERTTLEMEWRVRKSDIQDLIIECRNEVAPQVESTRLFSEPSYYHGGFLWKMVLFVHKKKEPKKRRGMAGWVVDVSSSEEETVFHDFLGVTCRAVVGGQVYTPLVGMAVELQASRFSALGEERQPQRTEIAGYVDDEIPYGVYDFFRVDNLLDADCLAPFTCFRGHLHLSCKVTRCA